MDTVAKVKESDMILLQGNFETQAQSLAMRQQSWLLACLIQQRNISNDI